MNTYEITLVILAANDEEAQDIVDDLVEQYEDRGAAASYGRREGD